MALFGNRPANDAKAEAERILLERLKARIVETLQKMPGTSPAEAERLHGQIKSLCTEKTLPVEFKRQSLEWARVHERNANMRETDKALHAASRVVARERMKERGQAMTEARKFYAKACALGADEDFKKAVQRRIDTIMMTGGIVQQGPTRAKPLDTAPKTPNRAKQASAAPAPNRAKL